MIVVSAMGDQVQDRFGNTKGHAAWYAYFVRTTG
jgi:hypothetical protein